MKAKIVLLPGDGIGPEVVGEARRVLEQMGRLHGHEFLFSEYLIGGSSIDRFQSPLTDETVAACKTADAVLLGAVGGQRWDNNPPALRPETGLLGLRKALGVFANLRPVKVHPALVGASPLKPVRLAGVDIIVVRELTGGLYFGQPKKREVREDGHEYAVDTLEYYDFEIRRVMDLAFRLGMGCVSGPGSTPGRCARHRVFLYTPAYQHHHDQGQGGWKLRQQHHGQDQCPAHGL